jgi:bifunctional DNA-binding transcriptional regulator/antitoxin component of YhaV-PrlF toxin-antitoxin module
MADEVKRRVPYTKVSRKNQVTLPVAALRTAGIGQGDELRVEAEADGRIVLVRDGDPLDRFIGAIPGIGADLEELRAEWER